MAKADERMKNVVLPTPQKIGGEKVESITLRKPFSGELRGLSVLDVVKMQVDTLATLMPRITTPSITPEEFATLEPENLAELSMEIAGFFTGEKSRKT
ncbi:phage tail assembly protein [Hydrogenovibrio sp. 3SP14C1]|uniref:phage tail assembly protein n=1 Tax=Hydrogenovibrio sp. 3SP14C1 TaxID=3038774 RepID=UPI0024167904|nr:phage tail assembly protein [Hydrogenovibrio sp. 3SP14C1]MDG4811654.1 phage tail assembly protein [Hydrogenovibrio sp. 3SP14C1]